MLNSKLTSSLIAVGVLALLVVAPIDAQQVFDGDHAVPPLYDGQTRAPLAAKSAPFVVSEFVTGLNRPWAMAHMPNGKMIVTEVPGRIRIISATGEVSRPVEGVPAVRAWGSRGLNDVILDPAFERNRKIYFAYLAAPDGMDSDNSDAAYAKSNQERQEWNALSSEEKATQPWGDWRVASATL